MNKNQHLKYIPAYIIVGIIVTMIVIILSSVIYIHYEIGKNGGIDVVEKKYEAYIRGCEYLGKVEPDGYSTFFPHDKYKCKDKIIIK